LLFIYSRVVANADAHDVCVTLRYHAGQVGGSTGGRADSSTPSWSDTMAAKKKGGKKKAAKKGARKATKRKATKKKATRKRR